MPRSGLVCGNRQSLSIQHATKRLHIHSNVRAKADDPHMTFIMTALIIHPGLRTPKQASGNTTKMA
jgi:hypothetical protein